MKRPRWVPIIIPILIRNALIYSSQIPRNYTSLHEHIAKRHPSLLKSYEEGWDNLSPHLQAKFHDPITNRFPAYFHTLPSRAMRFRVGNPPLVGGLMWSSWAYFAYIELDASQGWRGLYEFLELKMDHESSMFGVPPNPAEYGEFPEWMQTNLKSKIAIRVIDACLQRIKIEALLRMEQSLEKGGLEGFKLILNGESLIEELSKISISCHSSKE